MRIVKFYRLKFNFKFSSCKSHCARGDIYNISVKSEQKSKIQYFTYKYNMYEFFIEIHCYTTHLSLLCALFGQDAIIQPIKCCTTMILFIKICHLLDVNGFRTGFICTYMGTLEYVYRQQFQCYNFVSLLLYYLNEIIFIVILVPQFNTLQFKIYIKTNLNS